MGNMRIVTINVPKTYLKFVKILTDPEVGMYPSRSEFMRVAIKELVHKEIKRLKEVEEINELCHNEDGCVKVPKKKLLKLKNGAVVDLGKTMTMEEYNGSS